eukprot:tig00001042_g6582.t1
MSRGQRRRRNGTASPAPAPAAAQDEDFTAHYPGSRPPRPVETDTIPWDSLFPVPDGGDRRRGEDSDESEEDELEDEGAELFLGPRMAFSLHWHGSMMEDTLQAALRYEVDADNPDMYSFTETAGLPEVARPWTTNEAWASAYIDAFRRLLRELECGRVPRPTCTAEEMALHCIIREAEGGGAEQDPAYEELPESRCDDLGLLGDLLFEDEDVLLLYEQPGLAGGGPGHLHPRDWFRPFRADQVLPAAAAPQGQHAGAAAPAAAAAAAAGRGSQNYASHYPGPRPPRPAGDGRATRWAAAGEEGLSPRLAFRLHWHGTVLEDMLTEALEGPEGGYEFELAADLPEVALPFARKASWARAYVDALRRLLRELEGEEMVLHNVINSFDSDSILHSEGAYEALPRSGCDDLGLLGELLFEDEDVLLLYEQPGLAGGGSGHLHPRDWFRPFRADQVLPPAGAA